MQEFLQRAGLKNLGADTVHAAVDVRGRECKFHPVRDHLEILKWDGTARVENWLVRYLGAPETPYIQAVGRMFLISMVARVFDPGCKADYMQVLEGPQATLKSTTCRILGGAHFSDSLPDVMAGKDVSQHLRGKWLIEVSEMDAMSRAETTLLKAFITRQVEQYRPPYGRQLVSVKRSCVFGGTINSAAYLRDDTGARRFWPVRCGATLRLDSLKRDRDQLWAETIVRYQKGEPWWLDAPDLTKAAAEEQEERYSADPWEEPIHRWILSQVEITTADVLSFALQKRADQWTRADEMRVAAILNRLGWKAIGRQPKGPRRRIYRES